MIKDAQPATLVGVIRETVGAMRPPVVPERIGAPTHAAGGVITRKSLTPRETDALRGVVQGLSNKEIAFELGISESSVKAALQQVFDKIGVRTRSQLVRIAWEHYRELL